MKMTLRSIGTVKNGSKKTHEGDWQTVVSKLVIDKKYERALEQVDGFSHIIVLYWMNQLVKPKQTILKVRPRKRKDMPLVGVFATRSPVRPNPIGLTVVQVLECKANVIKVRGLDALDGTPVLDIKPYIPYSDSPRKTRTPAWIKKLHSC
jgi:tRNA-Thr(GGU) m(6)t(6)A37 methyltransferase TsaA